jgi:hypothetical protein
MPEPTTTTGLSLTALAIAILGPLAGPYSTILFAALAGTLWPLTSAEGLSKIGGAWLVLRCVLTAIVLTSTGAAIAASVYGVPPLELLAPVAFFIGALGNGWRPVISALGSMLAQAASKLGEGDK